MVPNGGGFKEFIDNFTLSLGQVSGWLLGYRKRGAALYKEGRSLGERGSLLLASLERKAQKGVVEDGKGGFKEIQTCCCNITLVANAVQRWAFRNAVGAIGLNACRQQAR